MAALALSYRQAATKSGGKVSHGTLNSIVTGRHTWRLDDRTVEGIATALDVDEDTVRRAAGQASRTEATEFVLPPRAQRLSAQDRRAVLVMIDALLSAGETRRDSDSDSSD